MEDLPLLRNPINKIVAFVSLGFGIRVASMMCQSVIYSSSGSGGVINECGLWKIWKKTKNDNVRMKRERKKKKKVGSNTVSILYEWV